jgi:putative transposase
MSDYRSNNRHKFLLQYHIIFVCKYRKKLFLSKCISDDIKSLSKDIWDKNNILIKYMETDKDHIHYMIETIPNISISKIVKLIKWHTTCHIWKIIIVCLKNIIGKIRLFGLMVILY